MVKPGHRCLNCELANRKLQALEQPDADEDDEPIDPDDVDGQAIDPLAGQEDEGDEPPAPPRAAVRKKAAFKPGTRQAAKAPDRVTGERPWWAEAKPGELTAAAETRQREMSNSAVGRQLKNDRNLGR